MMITCFFKILKQYNHYCVLFLGIILGGHKLYPELWWGSRLVWLRGEGWNPNGSQTGRLRGRHSRHPGVRLPVLYPPRQTKPPRGAHHESGWWKIPPALPHEPSPNKLLYHWLVRWVGRRCHAQCGSGLLLQCWVHHQWRIRYWGQ